jgi:pimeloyl-ACP methyl ester carboxylesterase
MREERIETNGVPARLYDPGDATGLLLLGHGGGQSKDDERFVGLGRQYAESTGLAVVCIDAVNHGERRPADAGPDVPPAWHEGAADTMVADWRATADALSDIGPAVAYVGFSMGMIFGAPTVAAMPSIRAAVFGVGGIPAPGGREDPRLRTLLLDVASRITESQVLLLNMTQDEIFPPTGTLDFFAAIPGRKKRLMFWEGNHVGIPAEAIRHSVDFLKKHTA